MTERVSNIPNFISILIVELSSDSPVYLSRPSTATVVGQILAGLVTGTAASSAEPPIPQDTQSLLDRLQFRELTKPPGKMKLKPLVIP